MTGLQADRNFQLSLVLQQQQGAQLLPLDTDSVSSTAMPCCLDWHPALQAQAAQPPSWLTRAAVMQQAMPAGQTNQAASWCLPNWGHASHAPDMRPLHCTWHRPTALPLHARHCLHLK